MMNYQIYYISNEMYIMCIKGMIEVEKGQRNMMSFAIFGPVV